MLGAITAPFIYAGSADASGAVSGPWCSPLTKAARSEFFDFSLELLDPTGPSMFNLSDCLGRPVWVQFFASWCGPCNNEAADVVRIAAKYGDAIHAVGIDVRESAERARGFRDQHKIPFPIALDVSGAVFAVFGNHGIPTHVFFDSFGGISCVTNGDLTPDQMDNEIAVALSRRGPVSSPSPTSKSS